MAETSKSPREKEDVKDSSDVRKTKKVRHESEKKKGKHIAKEDVSDEDRTPRTTKRKDANLPLRPPKAPVEDRALQAVLAARRRSIEKSKYPKNVKGSGDDLHNQIEYRVEKRKPSKAISTECEELSSSRYPLKWLSAVNTVFERTRRKANLWAQLQVPELTFQPVREILNRSLEEEGEYLSQIKMSPSQEARRSTAHRLFANKTKLRRAALDDEVSDEGEDSSISTSSSSSSDEDSGGESGEVSDGEKNADTKDKSEDEAIKKRIKNTKLSMHLRRELKIKKRMVGLGQEIYTDKVRAAAVTLGDQDIKTSLKVKQKNERRIFVPEEMDANVYLTEAQKNLVKGNLRAALICANQAVDTAGTDPYSLLMRSRCALLMGHPNVAFEDAQNALNKDPQLVRALLVQAEALYAMGEFERSLVLFHRGQRRRADLSDFQRGINKSREAILNTIGGTKFPEVKPATRHASGARKSVGGIPSESPSVEKKKEESRYRGKAGIEQMKTLSNASTNGLEGAVKMKKGKVSPLVSQIKTNTVASKRLLGGLSSDKEFLDRIISRGDLNDPKLRFTIETTGNGRKQVALASASDKGYLQGNVINVAKEALSSLQFLEAFLWQRDPNGLSVKNRRKSSQLTHHRRRGSSKDSSKGAADKGVSGPNGMKIEDMITKCNRLISKLEYAESDSLAKVLHESENFVEPFRQTATKSEECRQPMCRLLIAIGKALPRNGRAEDSLAVLKDAVVIAKERNLKDEYQAALDALGRVLAAEGQKEEAVRIWESLADATQTQEEKSSESQDTTIEENDRGSSETERNRITHQISRKNTIYGISAKSNGDEIIAR